MSPNRKSSDIGTARRRVLQSLGSVGAGLTFGSATVGTASAASGCGLPDKEDSTTEESYLDHDEDPAHYEDTDGSTYDHLTQLQTSMIYKSADYLDPEWIHDFRAGGYANTQRKRSWESTSGYELFGNMNYVKLTIENLDSNLAGLWTTSDPDWVGAAPAPSSGNDLNYGKAAYTVMVLAMRTNPYVAGVIGAAQLAGALLDNNESDSGYIQEYTWDYDWDDEPCENSHFARFRMESKDGNSAAHVAVDNVATNSGHGGVETSYSMYVDPVGKMSVTSDDSTVDSNTQPRPGDADYTDFLVQNGLARKIPFEKIQDPELRELADGRPVYRALNPQVRIESTSDVIPAGSA